MTGMQDKFDACNGFFFSQEHIYVVVRFLQILSLHIVGISTANLGKAVTMLLPQGTTSELQHMDPAAWEHAIVAWELAGLGSSGASSPADAEHIRKAAVKWEAGQVKHSDFISQSVTLQAGLDRAIWAGRELFKGMVSKRIKALKTAVSMLEKWAGGKDEQGSWKSSLQEESTWDDVQREADYYLQRKEGLGPLHKFLDKLFGDLQNARSELEAADDGLQTLFRLNSGVASPAIVPAEFDCKPLFRRALEVETDARVTRTESYFYMLVRGNSRDRATKIQNRIAGLAENKVSTARLQVLLWRKALAVSTARK
jgi:hypothetical protein